MPQKIAVVLFNLGGPTDQQSVRPFLWNLFKDPFIIRLPFLIRYPLAWFISRRRTPKAQKIYQQIGGGSPLNPNTKAQADALQELLKKQGYAAKVFMAMRYAPPFTDDCIKEIADFLPDQIALLPLYPQFSTTTTLSSLTEWQKQVRHFSTIHSIPTYKKCCYPTQTAFISAHQAILKKHLETLDPLSRKNLRLLFSAHGIPLDLVKKHGDPYAFQVEQTVNAVMDDPMLQPYSSIICYQSRVGPKKWLGPSLEEALQECAKKKQGVVVIPISFVSDHSETLVELDIQYKERAQALNIPHYSRVESLATHPLFIQSLAEMIQSMISGERASSVCPKPFHACSSLCSYGKFSD